MPVRRKRKIDPIPEEFESIEAAAEFWDTHDLTDYQDQMQPVENLKFRIKRRHYLFELEPTVVRKLRDVARERGISSETLANRWLKEKLNGLAVKPRKRSNRKAAKAS